MTARLSDRVEADAGWSSCGQEGASDLSGEVCPGFGAVWLSMTSALYTMEDQWNRGQMGVFCLSPCLPCLSVNLSAWSRPQSCLFCSHSFFLRYDYVFLYKIQSSSFSSSAKLSKYIPILSACQREFCYIYHQCHFIWKSFTLCLLNEQQVPHLSNLSSNIFFGKYTSFVWLVCLSVSPTPQKTCFLLLF